MSNTLKEKYGPWALVTGGSAGIGREFTEQLAAAGINIVLVARREDALTEASKSLESEHGIRTEIVVADLSLPEVAHEIAAAVKDLDIGLLVNNAGAAGPKQIAASALNEQVRTIDLNYRAPVALTQALLPKLRSRPKSGVIFLSSVIGYAPAPYLGTYGGSKQAVRQFGYLLARETKDDGVDVLVLSPGATRTELAEAMMGKAISMAMDPSRVVRAALNGLGTRREVVPGLMNKVMAFLNGRLLTQGAGARMNAKFTEMMMPEEVLSGRPATSSRP